MRHWSLAGLMLAASASLGVAAPVTILDAIVTADGAATPPLGITSALIGPAGFGGGILPGGEIPFTTGSGSVTISLQDFGLVGDVFEVVLDGASIGFTAPVRIGGPSNSSGSFVAMIGAGFHSLGIWDPVLTYLGTASPFGGTVPFDFTQTDLRLAVTFEASAVPEPSTLVLLGAALGGICLGRRRAVVKPVRTSSSK